MVSHEENVVKCQQAMHDTCRCPCHPRDQTGHMTSCSGHRSRTNSVATVYKADKCPNQTNINDNVYINLLEIRRFKLLTFTSCPGGQEELNRTLSYATPETPGVQLSKTKSEFFNPTKTSALAAEKARHRLSFDEGMISSTNKLSK